MSIFIPSGISREARIAIQKSNAKLTSNLTSDQLLYWNDGRLSSVGDLTSWVAGTANEIDITDDGDGTLTIGIVNPLIVSKGGTGAATFTDHSLLVGSGTDAFTAIGAATNGQIPIGSTGADPVLAGITGTANQITVTNGAGSITLSTPQDIDTSCDFSANTVDATTSYKVGGTQVVASQQSHIADATTQDLAGSDSIDETKLESDLSGIVSTINSILSVLETHGLVASS